MGAVTQLLTVCRPQSTTAATKAAPTRPTGTATARAPDLGGVPLVLTAALLVVVPVMAAPPADVPIMVVIPVMPMPPVTVPPPLMGMLIESHPAWMAAMASLVTSALRPRLPYQQVRQLLRRLKFACFGVSAV